MKEQTLDASRRERVIVIGLDGATLDLVEPLIAAGRLKNLSKLIREGAFGVLASTIPMSTPTAWSSIVTGKNPGKHGIFDFLIMKKGSYEVVSVNSTFRRAEGIWNVLNRHGRRVVIVNVPFTYPPEKIEDAMITGFITPRKAKDYTYPSDLALELKGKEISCNFRPEEVLEPGNEDVYIKDLYEKTENLLNVVTYLLSRYDWEFFMVVFNGIDRVQHAFWEYMDPKHPAYSKEKNQKYGDVVFRYYEKVDEIIGEILNKIETNVRLIVVSDHGAGLLHTYLNLSLLFRRLGYLNFKRNKLTQFRLLLHRVGFTPMNLYKIMVRLHIGKLRESVDRSKTQELLSRFFLSFSDIDWKKTKAYVLRGQIYINLKGREPQGIVEQGSEYEKLRDEIIEVLSDIRDPSKGDKIFEKVLKKELVYSGPETYRAPDILHIRNVGYQVFPEYDFASNKLFDEVCGFSCGHKMNGIMLLKADEVKKGAKINAKAVDVLPTILYMMDLPIPADVDGKVLKELFDEEMSETRLVRFEESIVEKYSEEERFLKEHEKELEEVLRGLGYL